ncbi:S1 family peptidase [Corynebacterium sp. AOP40-9SA-29]|uniref:S1 family peptidase n=1 Tax=Corynebacterium sp. AOP40-9SA-29 TaxID=3457677 RepID=UPI004033A608
MATGEATGADSSEEFQASACPDVDLPYEATLSDSLDWIKDRKLIAEDAGRCVTWADAREYLESRTASSSPAATTPATAPDLGSSSSSDRAEGKVDASDRKIYRNSRDFDYLNTMGKISPGVRYYIENGGSCSFGWTVAKKDQPSRIYNLTAGHCGNEGDRVYITAASGEKVNVGEFVESYFDGTPDNVGPGDDYGLIEIYSEYQEYIEATPSVNVGGTPLSLGGWRSAEWLESAKPYICRLGWRSGLSCGNFQDMLNAKTLTFDAIQDQGDSGGAIWAVDPTDQSEVNIYAVGVASFGYVEDATTAGAKVVGPMMDKFGFTIYG